MHGRGISSRSCSQVIFTPVARKPMLSAASLIPSIDTPSRVI